MAVTTTRRTTTKPAASKPAAKKTVAAKKPAAKKTVAAKKPAASKTAATKNGRHVDPVARASSSHSKCSSSVCPGGRAARQDREP